MEEWREREDDNTLNVSVDPADTSFRRPKDRRREHMNRKILGMFINAIVFISLATTAWAAPDWWRGVNDPIQPTEAVTPRTEPPEVIKETRFEEYPPNYAALKIGGFLPLSNEMEFFDNAFYGELGFGHYFNNHFAVELGVGYTKPEGSLSGPGSSASFDLTIIPVTLGVRGSIPSKVFEPFATAGLGAYFAEIESSVSGPGFSRSASEDDINFGFYLGLGANFNVSPNVYLGVEGRYFWTEPSFESFDTTIYGIHLTANVGYRF
jgi:opacity protein-like surface antigen